jgi:hypothetical protein
LLELHVGEKTFGIFVEMEEAAAAAIEGAAFALAQGFALPHFDEQWFELIESVGAGVLHFDFMPPFFMISSHSLSFTG